MRRVLDRVWNGAGAAAWALALVAAAATLWSAWCAFTWGKFTLVDYGKYTNMIWNSGHGRPLRLLLDQTYLSTHLSFSLVLLGPLFRLWDHPFLLALVQWSGLAGGAALLHETVRREGVPPGPRAALALVYVAFPFTQSVLLSEFHGVALLYLLLPWLHYTLVHARRWAWLPLALTLGLREDAFIAVLPLLLYVAAARGRREGYLYALVAAAYGAAAILWLFPALGGMPITARRPSAVPASLGSIRVWFSPKLAWLLLAALPFLPRGGWRPLLAIPSAALLQIVGSGVSWQRNLESHYPAALMAAFGVGAAEALVVAFRRGRAVRTPLGAGWVWYLAAVTVVAQQAIGFLPPRGEAGRVYARPNPHGVAALRAARAIPRTGLLVTSARNAGYCANRADYTTWELLPAGRQPDLLLFDLRELSGRRGRSRYLPLLEGDAYGATWFEDGWVVLERGADPRRNAEVVRAFWATPGAVRAPGERGTDDGHPDA